MYHDTNQNRDAENATLTPTLHCTALQYVSLARRAALRCDATPTTTTATMGKMEKAVGCRPNKVRASLPSRSVGRLGKRLDYLPTRR